MSQRKDRMHLSHPLLHSTFSSLPFALLFCILSLVSRTPSMPLPLIQDLGDTPSEILCQAHTVYATWIRFFVVARQLASKVFHYERKSPLCNCLGSGMDSVGGGGGVWLGTPPTPVQSAHVISIPNAEHFSGIVHRWQLINCFLWVFLVFSLFSFDLCLVGCSCRGAPCPKTRSSQTLFHRWTSKRRLGNSCDPNFQITRKTCVFNIVGIIFTDLGLNWLS